MRERSFTLKGIPAVLLYLIPWAIGWLWILHALFEAL